MKTRPLQIEQTAQGEQALVPGVKPITKRDRLQAFIDPPLLPRRAQSNVGLYDEEALNQLDLFAGDQS